MHGQPHIRLKKKLSLFIIQLSLLYPYSALYHFHSSNFNLNIILNLLLFTDALKFQILECQMML